MNIIQVSSLWSAANKNHLDVVRELVKRGADINTSSDTQSTAVRSACFSGYTDIVKYLVEHGADIHQPNKSLATCLISTVIQLPLCRYIIEKGATINAQDINGYTALHYAVEKGKIEVVQLLLQHSADLAIFNIYGDDALRYACLWRRVDIIEYLIQAGNYSLKKQINSYLLGASFVSEGNFTEAVTHWNHALHIKKQANIIDQKENVSPLIDKRVRNNAFKNFKEVRSIDELSKVSEDEDHIRIMSIKIYERILGHDNVDTIDIITDVGLQFGNEKKYTRFIELYSYFFHLSCKNTRKYTSLVDGLRLWTFFSVR